MADFFLHLFTAPCRSERKSPHVRRLRVSLSRTGVAKYNRILGIAAHLPDATYAGIGAYKKGASS
jgi:hypothetical protein